MSEAEELQERIADLKDKLSRAQRQLAGLKEKGKYLRMQYDDARGREHTTSDVIRELLERQRELNVMLNRANIMLNRTQEAMALTSIEFNEMAKALPEPKKAEWSDRVSRINELFKKTGIQDAELVPPSLGSSSPGGSSLGRDSKSRPNERFGPGEGPPDSLETDELKRESEEAFRKGDSIWGRAETPEPRTIEAVPVDDAPEADTVAHEAEPEVVMVSAEPATDGNGEVDENSLIFPPRRKSWWRRAAG